jgi:hypothetical protein
MNPTDLSAVNTSCRDSDGPRRKHAMYLTVYSLADYYSATTDVSLLFCTMPVLTATHSRGTSLRIVRRSRHILSGLSLEWPAG